jgi:DNA-binding transcriptional LysR family regulator
VTTLHQLRCFLTAYEQGSLTAAAAELGYAQPSVSEQVRVLEGSLGARLFERVGRGLVPTEAAHELVPHARQALAAVDAGRAAVRSVTELETGTVRFGVFGTARIYLATEVVLCLLEQHPGVRVELVGQNSLDVQDELRRGRMEAAVIALPVADPSFAVHPVLKDELVYVSAHPERLRRPVSGARLAQAPLVLAEASWGVRDVTRAQIALAAEAEGHALQARVEVEDTETTIEVAASGEADTIVALGALHLLGERVPRRLGWVPLRPRLHDSFAIVHRQGAVLSPATRVMTEIVAERLRQVGASARRAGNHRLPQASGSQR